MQQFTTRTCLAPGLCPEGKLSDVVLPALSCHRVIRGLHFGNFSVQVPRSVSSMFRAEEDWARVDGPEVLGGSRLALGP